MNENNINRLMSIRVTIDTPNEVCDGRVTDTVGNLIKRYGEECLAWIVEERPAAEIKAMREVCDAAKRWADLLPSDAFGKWQQASRDLENALKALAALKAEGEVKP